MDESEGLKLLKAFVKEHALSIAAFHQGLVKRFGADRVRYRRVYSWVMGDRRPDKDGREMLRVACKIDPHAWLRPEEIKGEQWQEHDNAAMA